MIYVYYSGVGEESAEALAKVIKELGADVTLWWQKEKGTFSPKANDLCVNWGTRCPDRDTAERKWLNRQVRHNKLSQIKRLADHSVPTVEFQIDTPASGKWYARQVEHRDGSDLERKLERGDFYVKHVDTKVEYRAHIFKGEALRFSRKNISTKFLEPGEKINEKFRIGNGWVFSDHNYLKEVGPKMVAAAIAAVKAVDYDFGGVDIAYTTDGQPLVFEVNSAPWLGGEMQRAYAQRIIALQ